ncbi:helix-turn-helix domain-containing protein [Paenibacillus sp. NAIST15-1]|uniref:AlbA family DNA-binding domain-containing protein n=1 Tax=Paenibacillus sp. NAIST15-1 TaxID=1605994 RepID=UPI00086ECC17|nr:ATP-binding protein [Paenibacillus sp. NAIST15-1]GAV15886.1 putative transcriptional regulator [Paenibacillus sp. NAIST15-1]
MNTLKESFAQFIEEPTREGLREVLRTNLGETNNLDFKEEWPAYPKVAKLILALANSGGGCIIFGVKESESSDLIPVGINEIVDKAEIQSKLCLFLPDELTWEVLDFRYNDSEYSSIVGKKYQVIFVKDDPEHIPFITQKNGENIKNAAIYVRRGTSSEEVNYVELQKIVNRRIETGYSTTSEIKLEEHLSQLQILFSNVEKYKFTSLLEPLRGMLLGTKELNPKYPEEDYESFILRMISRKKLKIERLIDN